MPKEDGRMAVVVQELVRRSNEEGRRLRDLEQRLEALESRANLLEQNEMEKTKRVHEKFMQAEASLRSLSDVASKLKLNMEKITKQMLDLARKRDVKELEKMFELLSPIRQEFLTKDELEKLEGEAHRH